MSLRPPGIAGNGRAGRCGAPPAPPSGGVGAGCEAGAPGGSAGSGFSPDRRDDEGDEGDGGVEGLALDPDCPLGGRLLSDSNGCTGRWVGLLITGFDVDALDVLAVG